MLIIKSPVYDPWFNIASEEYILQNFTDDVFLLYINDPSIIVGKYQNTISQLNLDYVRKNNIKVVRRLTGGGAVFHDHGNLNFSFICRKKSDDTHTFHRYTEPILLYLNSLGINACLKGRNDLVIADMKFSGNARLVTQDKILQHGTILFESRINDLTQALKVNPLKFKDKAVKSVQSRVTNVSEHLTKPMTIQEFENGLFAFITSHYEDTAPYAFSLIDLEKIKKLAADKYSTWKWNFGQSPQYNYTKTWRTAGGNVEISLQVNEGIIQKCELHGDFFAKGDISVLEKGLENTVHDHESVKERLQMLPVDDILLNIGRDDLLQGIF